MTSKIPCNGTKVRELRAKAGMTQEKLAIMSDIDVRTVQRAEKSTPLQLETLASLAAALKVTVNDLTKRDEKADGAVSNEEEVIEKNAVLLRPVSSGKMLLDLIQKSFSGTVLCNVEPTEQNIETLSAIVEKTEGLIPDPWSVEDFLAEAPSLATTLRESLALTGQLQALEKLDVAIYAGTYTASALKPRYDMDTGDLFTSYKQQPEPVTVCRIVFDRLGLNRVLAKVGDKWVEAESQAFGRRASASKQDGGDDDLPF
ncbi:MAG TPA: helix-turn-helix transcriptional regulator [Beijerinckiaceae bacterium]|jgi:transcriptional regulator with XRE-family HTH domain|nr:helix-turn-helix transcriptional regulator [Beijerinckiaceae bacterium]